MGKVRLAIAKAHTYKQHKQEAEKQRQSIIDILQNLKNQCLKRQITLEDYQNKTKEKYQGKTYSEWVNYYDEYIKECDLKISQAEQHTKKTKTIVSLQALFIFGLFAIVLYALSPSLLGFSTKEVTTLQDNLNLKFTHSANYDWSPIHSGQLTSVQVSGRISPGNYKIYLEDKLIFDSATSKSVKTVAGSLLTGNVIDESGYGSSSPSNSGYGSESNSDSISDSNSDNSHTNHDRQPEQEGQTIQPNLSVPPALLDNSSIEQIENITLGENNTQEINETLDLSSFTKICEDTCSFQDLAEQSSYNLRIEMDSGVLYLDSVHYNVVSDLQDITNNTIIDENLTSTNLTQQQAVLGQPVRWIKTINLDEPSLVTINIPEQAELIKVSKGSGNSKEITTVRELGNKDNPNSLLTGNVIDESGYGSLDSDQVFLTEEPSSSYEVIYETPAPIAKETKINEREKQVTISSPDNLHYTNVTSFSALPINLTGSGENVKLYWIVDGIKQLQPAQLIDTDKDSLLDTIEWITPHLSDQVFEIIIEVTKAEQLDSDYSLIGDIYPEVRALDNVWSPTINNKEYVRVTFDKELTSQNDIKIYPKVISGNPKVEVYESGSNVKIAEFSNILDNEYNEVYLTGLVGSQDTFDLKVVSGSLQFDHILDPTLTNLIPSSGTQNVTSGALTENTHTISSQTNLVSDCYTNISVLSDGKICLEDEGSNALDAYFLWNVTLPAGNTSLNWIYLRANVSLATTNGTDSLSIAVFNWTGNRWQNFSFQKPANLNIYYLLSTNITGGAISNFVNNTAGNKLRFMVRSNGTLNVDTDINVEYMGVQVSWNDSTAPTVNLSAPANNTYTNLPSFTFNASALDNGNFANMTLFIWNSSSTLVNQTTQTKSGSSNSTNVTVSFLYNGPFYWNYYATDTDNNRAFNNTNFTIIYETTNPQITVNSPANQTYTSFPILFNVTSNEDINFCNYTLDSGITNVSMQKNGLRDLNYSNNSLADGAYTVKYYCWDLANNLNNTQNKTFTIDDNFPSINLIDPSNGTIINSASLTNVSFNATFADNLGLKNATFYLWNSSNSLINTTSNLTISGTSSFVNLTVQLTKEGTYYWNYLVTDGAGNAKFNESNSTVNYTIAAPNTAPQIYNVSTIPAQTPTEAGSTKVYFNFSVVDADGASDLKDVSARANFTFSTEPVRQNLSCSELVSAGNYANYTCSIDMQYFDSAASWTIRIAINDTLDTVGINQTTIFTYSELSAFVSGPGNLSFSTLNPGSTNQTANNDPLVLNNTGNKAITDGNILLNATNLVGESISTQAIYANNFSAAIITGSNTECNVATNMTTALSKSVFALIPNATLSRGNNSANDGSTGQEYLYLCIRQIGSEISSQAYSTTNQGAWTIKILASAFIIGTRKRKKKVPALDKAFEQLESYKESNSLTNEQLAQTIVNELKKREQQAILDKAFEQLESYKEKSQLSSHELGNILIEEIKKRYNINKSIEEEKIPVSIFTQELGGLEAICRYLKERGLRYSEIAKLIKRDQRTVWTAYHKAMEKKKSQFDLSGNVFYIPLNYISEREGTIFEKIILYLKERGLRYSEIAKLLGRDERNVWTICQRALKRQKYN